MPPVRDRPFLLAVPDPQEEDRSPFWLAQLDQVGNKLETGTTDPAKAVDQVAESGEGLRWVLQAPEPVRLLRGAASPPQAICRTWSQMGPDRS